MSHRTILTNIAASNIFTSAITVQGHQRVGVRIIVGSAVSAVGSIISGGSMTMTATLQRSYDNGDYWADVDNWSVATESISAQPEPQTTQYRFGVKIGDYTSGEIIGELRAG